MRGKLGYSVICTAFGCTRRTRDPRLFCFQHIGMADNCPVVVCELHGTKPSHDGECHGDTSCKVVMEILNALRNAYKELNEIHARDGVPYTHQGIKSSVSQEWFTHVVEQARAAIKRANPV